MGYGPGAAGEVTTKLVVIWPEACDASSRKSPAKMCVRIGFIFFNSGVWVREIG
jgi:hypothetical protein